MTLKKCCTCDERKPLDQFHKNRREDDGHARMCKPCVSSANKKSYRKHRDKYVSNAMDWQKRNPHRYAQLKRKSSEAYRKRQWLKRHPGKTEADYKVMQRASQPKIRSKVHYAFKRAAKAHRLGFDYYARFHPLYPYARKKITGARKRAREKNVPFDLDAAYVLRLILDAGDRCPILGTPFDDSPNNVDTYRSLDRIVPQLGYVKGNAQIISMRANTLKSSATPAELRRIADWVEANAPDESWLYE